MSETLWIALGDGREVGDTPPCRRPSLIHARFRRLAHRSRELRQGKEITMNAPQSPTAVYQHTKDVETFRRMGEVIQRNLPRFRKKGVISVRPGYKAAGGWLTRKPAIVVTVLTKSDSVSPRDMLPTEVDGFAVDVRQASPVEKLRAHDPQAYAQVAAGTRREYALPQFEFEHDPTSGTRIAEPPRSTTLEAHAAKPELPYTPANEVRLERVTAPMSIVCHASPDAGWPVLKTFFSEIQSTLTVGMYDFRTMRQNPSTVL